MPPFLGVTVLPEYVQSEGAERVLDNLQRAGATAVATSPYVMAPADEATGVREPPADAGAGDVRLLDRPLWGRRELFVKASPSFTPHESLYGSPSPRPLGERGRYRPAPADELTRRSGRVVREFLEAARGRGLRTCFQVMAAIPPGYRVQFGGPLEEDAPRLPDGRVPARRVANNASLASDAVRAYCRALLADLAAHYGDVLDAIRLDWPEYPPYLIDSMFLDFCPHARAAAERLGFDFAEMQQDAAALYIELHGGLTDDDLENIDVAAWRAEYPGAIEMLKLKGRLSAEFLADQRQALSDNEAAAHIDLEPSAFPPPWNAISGMDYAAAAPSCAAISVKLYGMHWAMMLHFYGEQLLRRNPGLSETKLVRALVALLGIADDEGHSSLADYRYPAPSEPHPAGERAQLAKIAEAQRQAGDCPIHVLAHAYGPADDFERRLRIARRAGPHGVWVNRYGYLSDEKLAACRRVFG